MQITRQADYAVRAIVFLAQQEPGRLVATAKIAQAQHIPGTFLAKIMAQLTASGLVYSTRGARGGVRLARPAAAISLLEVVEAIDGPILLNECVADPERCPMGSHCTVQRVWCQVQADLVDRLGKTMFAQLMPPASVALGGVAEPFLSA